ncbi:MAG TPA: hypothetical protein VF644_00095 [Pyrinomonadaceae bacterium]|jgi:hypothetical protein
MRQKITFLLLSVFTLSLLFIVACSGSSTGNQAQTNSRANAGGSPSMVSNQTANSPTAVGSNANNMANAAHANH